MVRSPGPLNVADHLREEAIAIAPVLRLRAVMTLHMDVGIRCLLLSLHQSLLRSSLICWFFFFLTVLVFSLFIDKALVINCLKMK